MKKGNGNKFSKENSSIKYRRHRRVVNLRNTVFVFISLIVIFTMLIVIYLYRLLDQNKQIIVPIVSSHVISDGILDHLTDPNDEEGSISSISSQSNTQNSVTYWGSGRVKVYVDPNFPIIHVDQKDPSVENFLIFGVDSRSVYEQKSRTDSLIIVTLDKTYNTIKMTSILRDTQVKIPGRTQPAKINAAYVFGGIGLLISTINENFDLDIQEFAMADMWSAEKIIDAMGGIMINVKSNEVEQVNENLQLTNEIFSNNTEKSPYLTKPGMLLLNGRQSVAYGRIRNIGSDLVRTERQRKVLTELIKQFKVTSLTKKMSVLDEIVQSFESNISKNDMLFLAIDAFSLIENVAQYRVPADGVYTTNPSNWQVVIDFDKQLPSLHDFIWGPVLDNAISLPHQSTEFDSSFSDENSTDLSNNNSFNSSSQESQGDSSDWSESCVTSAVSGSISPTGPPVTSGTSQAVGTPTTAPSSSISSTISTSKESSATSSLSTTSTAIP